MSQFTSAWFEARQARQARQLEACGHRADAAPKSEVAERELHVEFEAWLKERGWFYVHARMDVPSTIQIGHPDFTVFMPNQKTAFVEFKTPGKKATTEQLAKIAQARKFGFPAWVLDDLDEAKRLIVQIETEAKQ